eukprot:9459827-Prorocentrum_lima.AAC.1
MSVEEAAMAKSCRPRDPGASSAARGHSGQRPASTPSSGRAEGKGRAAWYVEAGKQLSTPR